MKKFLLCFIATLPVLSGCATLTRHPTASSIAVQYATAKVIEAGQTAEERLQKAERIKAIAGEAKTWLNGEGVTVEFLQQVAFARLAKLDLGTADRLLAASLVTAVVQELQAKVGTGAIPPDKLVTVNQLLGWIITAAELYGA